MQFVAFWVNLNFRNTVHFLDLMQPCLWTEFILKSPRKRVL